MIQFMLDSLGGKPGQGAGSFVHVHVLPGDGNAPVPFRLPDAFQRQAAFLCFILPSLLMICGFSITMISGPLQKAMIRFRFPIIFAASPTQRSALARSVSTRSSAIGKSAEVAARDLRRRKIGS